MSAGRPRGHGLDFENKKHPKFNFEKFLATLLRKIFQDMPSKKICRVHTFEIFPDIGSKNFLKLDFW